MSFLLVPGIERHYGFGLWQMTAFAWVKLAFIYNYLFYLYIPTLDISADSVV